MAKGNSIASSLSGPSFYAVALAFLLLNFNIGPARADESMGSGQIKSSGGQFFAQRLELPMVDFAQDDPRWSEELLGPTNETLGDQGCTLTSVVMVLNYYGIRSTPSSLNRYLTTHEGYDSEGLLDFDRVPSFAPDRIQLAYQGPASYHALDHDLLRKHPVIVQVTRFDGARHFVVVVGKQGFDYLVRDPAADPPTSLVVLKTLTPQIEQQFLYLKRN